MNESCSNRFRDLGKDAPWRCSCAALCVKKPWRRCGAHLHYGGLGLATAHGCNVREERSRLV